MADQKPDIYNGEAHATPASAPQGGESLPTMAFTRPFTLYEALPYTPFSAIAPFDSGTFPTFTHSFPQYPNNPNPRF
jgi:cohesin loading factor subunit SCC2